MTNERKLSALVHSAHFLRKREIARKLAVKYGCPIFIYRGKAGLMIDTAAPTMGERWMVETSGNVAHVQAPIA